MPKSPTVEQLNVEQLWRLTRLLQLGFKSLHAEDLLDVPDVEHKARQLLDAGCPPTLAYRILRT